MPAAPVGVTDTAPGSGVADIDVIIRASPEIFTTTTADPGAAGTSLAATLRDAFPQSGNFYVKVENELMLVTAGQGTGAGSFTVTRGQLGTTAVAHAIGVRISYGVSVQRVEPIDATKQISYIGRASTFATLGRAGTTGQKVFAIFNGASSKVRVDVHKLSADVMQTVAKVVEPAKIRAWRVTTLPTNGNNVTKVPEDSSLSSDTNVAVLQDSSADNTGSTTTLTATLPAGTVLDQEWVARALTLVGYEQFDKSQMLIDEDDICTLLPGEGIVVFLDYTVATANPVTDKYLIQCRWKEYTLA
jgi:hypothetical protein